MRILLFFIAIFTCFVTSSQIKGTITDQEDNPLSFVSVYLENSVTGTTSNDNGKYFLEVTKPGNYTVVFQILGFITQKKTISISKFPFVINVKMEEEKVVLNEITISTKENPAIPIIRNAIANKNKNNNKLAKYSAKFYSRGLWKIKDAPESFMGQNLGDFGGGLDSTRSGIVYLSETVSEIISQKNPNRFKEKIIASKVAGEDNGISFNRAEQVNFNFYNNNVDFGNDLISPISSVAFGYYNYKLLGSFYEKGKLINKIGVIPKRENDRVFKGFIYIVEDDWAIYGTDFTVTGEQVNSPAVNELSLKQSYNYASENDAWVVISQKIEFDAGLFGFNFTGKFSSGYSDYNFNPIVTESTFGSEVLTFEENATKKDSVYWKSLRPVPLTLEEQTGYRVKDSINIIRKSKPYLDSLDQVRNKFTFGSLFTSYSYRNTHKNWRFSIESPVFRTSFNTVQGFNSRMDLNYFNAQNKKGKWWNVNAEINYGFADQRVRPVVTFTRNWNNISRPRFFISGGVEATQFNRREPIKNLDNIIRSLFRRKSYMKLFDKQFAKIGYSEEIKNGIYLYTDLEYANRKPLFNNSNFSFVSETNNRFYDSNNPLDPDDFTTAAIQEHQIATLNVGFQFTFNQKYLSYPNQKFNLFDSNAPVLKVNYRKTFAASNPDFNSDVFIASLAQDINTGVTGNFSYYLRGGAFVKKKDIAFPDNLQVKGNQIFIVDDNIRKYNFGLLAYYQFFTNDKYAEAHVAHNFRGAILSRIPLINKLNFHLLGGAKAVSMANNKPYFEYHVGLTNLGFKKWRFFRFDYVTSSFDGSINNGWLLGLNLL